MRTRDTPTISTSDMDTIATAFPALQHLAISNMLMGRRHQLQLQPLSRLTGLRALSLASDALMPESILASLTCLKGLPRLELTKGTQCAVLAAGRSSPCVAQVISTASCSCPRRP